MQKEFVKSLIIGTLSGVALVCWLYFQPRLPDVAPKEKIGKPLFEGFDDPAAMRRVEFVGVDPATGEPKTLTLLRDRTSDVWRLPQFLNFPAENAEGLSKVVAPIMQLSALDVSDEATRGGDAKKIAELHRECGVLDPNDVDVDDLIPDSGAPLAVKIEGESGVLVDLIVGVRAPESSATRDVRYVRVPGDDVVYTVDFSGESTQEDGTTEFAEFPARVSFDPLDWVDRDVLRISRWNVATLAVRDYSFARKPAAQDGTPGEIDFKAVGVAVFKQTPENNLSRVWSTLRRIDATPNGDWKEAESVDPESAKNDVLNETADALGALKFVDVRKKPDALARILRTGDDPNGAELAKAAGAVFDDLGFATVDVDPLNPDKIVPSLVGEGGALEATTKEGIKITVVFGKKLEDKRACWAFAAFDRKALEAAVEDETELAFLAPDAEKKAELKNDRFADWFYLISEEDFQKIKFRFADALIDGKTN